MDCQTMYEEQIDMYKVLVVTKLYLFLYDILFIMCRQHLNTKMF